FLNVLPPAGVIEVPGFRWRSGDLYNPPVLPIVFISGSASGGEADHPVPCIINGSEGTRWRADLRHRSHVPGRVISGANPRWRARDSADLVDLITGTALAQVGRTAGERGIAAPVARGIERVVELSHRRSADAGLGAVERSALGGGQTVQMVIDVVFIQARGYRVGFPDAVGILVIAILITVPVGARVVVEPTL